jgi:hypothetical protein
MVFKSTVPLKLKLVQTQAGGFTVCSFGSTRRTDDAAGIADAQHSVVLQELPTKS